MNAEPRARRIAIASGKGGVGKTWFAITLAGALARAGRRVLLFDGDLGLANIDIQLGLPPGPDLAHVLAGKLALAEAVRPAGGFSLIAGRSGCGALASLGPEALRSLIAALSALPHDDILLDLAAGLDHGARALAASAERLLVLATDEPTSLTDAYAVLKLHRQDRGAGAAVVVNQAASVAAGQRTYATLARACESFLGAAPPLAGIVRRDERVRDAIRHQTGLLTRHPGSPAAEDVRAIARRLEQWRCAA